MFPPKLSWDQGSHTSACRKLCCSHIPTCCLCLPTGAESQLRRMIRGLELCQQRLCRLCSCRAGELSTPDPSVLPSPCCATGQQLLAAGLCCSIHPHHNPQIRKSVSVYRLCRNQTLTLGLPLASLAEGFSIATEAKVSQRNCKTNIKSAPRGLCCNHPMLQLAPGWCFPAPSPASSSGQR